MSEIGLNINVDSYNNEGIKTIKGNNNAEIYKLYILKNKRRLSLVGKTVKLGYVMAGTTNGDVIENLNITNAEQGEITFPITNRISKQDGVYSCQLAIYGADGFLEHTATFGLTVEANIFTKIAGEIADSKDFTYLENILDKASKLSEKLKENTSTATNANSNLESNITEANNINSKLLENTSTATSLNKNLESNIDLAKEVKETIKDLDTKNIEATEKIETLTGLNSKAEELSDNINKGLPLNSELVKNTEEAKTANTNLAATNQEATSKNTELQASLKKTKEFIEGLDGSQNIPQIRMDVTELQNGLKSNQALSYEGSSISANNTLEGRTEGMRIGGRTLVNLVNYKKIREYVATGAKSDNDTITWDFDNFEIPYNNWNMIYDTLDMCEAGKTYTAIFNVLENTTEVIKTGEKTGISIMNWNVKNGGNTWPEGDYVLKGSGIILKKLTFEKGSLEKSKIAFNVHGKEDVGNTPKRLRGKFVLSKKIMILEGDWTNKEIPSFFEGLKSFGEEEKVGDKYKISILSYTGNLLDIDLSSPNVEDGVYYHYVSGAKIVNNDVFTSSIKLPANTRYSLFNINRHVSYWVGSEFKGSVKNNFTDNVFTTQVSPPYDCTLKVTVFKVNKNSAYCTLGDNKLTPCQPYKEPNKKDILIKEPLKEREYIYEDNGQVKVCRKSYEYTLNGENEDWIVWTNSTGDTVNAYVYFNRMTPNLSGIVKPNSSNINDRLPANQGGYLSTKEGFKITSEYFAISIHKSKLRVTNVNDPNNSTLIKKWLKANPITFVCQRATPVVEVVDGVIDIDLDTFGEKTYFNILNSLPGTLDFKVPSNIASIVQANSKAINELYNLIDTLVLPNILQNTTDIEMLKLEKLK